jgi:hypothetical protein
MGLHQIKKLLHGKRNNKQSEETVCKMGGKSLPDIHLTED